ncbi:hypothetical protein [Paenisporosarcina quisquiliarum]|uniref:hypothetical protein n=1 Tax=Paenisporosarcina quisquiliarum TaxID=365346 RepID=UPI003735F8AE
MMTKKCEGVVKGRELNFFGYGSYQSNWRFINQTWDLSIRIKVFREMISVSDGRVPRAWLQSPRRFKTPAPAVTRRKDTGFSQHLFCGAFSSCYSRWSRRLPLQSNINLKKNKLKNRINLGKFMCSFLDSV